ncbi:MAG: SDR family NAD(P)-dependent oxidoreductase [bacterium]|nr:SDR family NAD(P)-dependent oxidoreductase [bacterium]MXZ29874.1 SDR family NAD(P)-dependent oxidoreductase [Acidimicrobiia bacterium]MDE0668700.1 SDR family NAD(P)-dependent oxidoreductase [bacterium]MYB23924.1 SDR family NAD(P)-dependent oxidoreductase [Acidimicrobiia bacterium]MYE67451.1 SDR family NAD(P)-dependent oxidoreductase [Acidimicrobiia bacterium]
MAGLCEGRTAVVTGAGRGIGRQHALMLAAAGAKVVVNDLGGPADGGGADIAPARQVVEEITAAGGEAIENGDDVSDFHQAKDMIHQAIDTFGGLDILINNAGILRDRMVFSMSEHDWDAVLAVHLKGTFAPTHHAAAWWRQQAKSGVELDARVINTSSPSGIYGNLGQTNYGAAKAGIAAFTVICAMELARYGVTVNCLSPSALTRLTIPVVGEENAPNLTESWSPRWIATVATWLASPEASGVTGRVFHVSGDQLGIAEGWRLGPVTTQPDDPAQLGQIVRSLMADARLNADMGGLEAAGPGRPAKEI